MAKQIEDVYENILKCARKEFFEKGYIPISMSPGALFPVWLCNGLWHGPRWSFLFFGMYYFVLILLSIGVEPWVEKWKARIPIVGNSRVFAGFQILRTWVLVVIGELFFRAEGLKQGIGMFWSMIKGWRFSQLWDGSLMKLGLDRMDFCDRGNDRDGGSCEYSAGERKGRAAGG